MGEPASPAMREILERYGRKRKNGTLIYCTPSQAEWEQADRPRSMHKVIYDSETIAQAAALAIYNLAGVLMFSYSCSRSRRGHRHLTHDAPKGYARLRGKAKYRKPTTK